MGMVKCPHHGLSGMTLCCPHIEEAVHAGEPVSSEVAFNGHAEPTFVCAACWSHVKANAVAPKQLGVNLPAGQAETPCCWTCFTEWYAAHHVGDPLQHIEEAKAAVRGAVTEA